MQKPQWIVFLDDLFSTKPFAGGTEGESSAKVYGSVSSSTGGSQFSGGVSPSDDLSVKPNDGSFDFSYNNGSFGQGGSYSSNEFSSGGEELSVVFFLLKKLNCCPVNDKKILATIQEVAGATTEVGPHGMHQVVGDHPSLIPAKP